MEKDFFARKPKYCCWVLNYRCMFRCKMCNIWNTDANQGQETTMEQKKQLVRSLQGLVEPSFEFHLSGGEPLMTEGILDLVDFIGQQGYRTNLVTNGFLIDETMAKQIANSRLDTLTISLDGATAQTHDFIRGIKGSHAQVMQAIDYLDKLRKDGKPKISILTIIMERNLDEILKLVDWVQEDKRIEMISFQAITQPFGEAADSAWFSREKNNIFWPQDAAKTSAVMEKLRELRLSGGKIGNHRNHFLHFKEYFQDPDKFLKKIKCNLGDYEFHIDPYGKTFFCCLMDPIGNIKTDNLPEIWNSSRARNIRENVYHCNKNCHIMVNCFYEDEASVNVKS
jgi:MoaA/NifB/PqqE/SkfB family radical SAM enzyme